MEHDKMEKRDAKRQTAKHENYGSAALTAWKIVGGTIIALAVVTFAVALPDLRRYIKISRM